MSASLPLGDVAEEEGDGHVSPPVSAGVTGSRVQDDPGAAAAAAGGSSTLDQTAREGTEFVGEGTDFARKPLEREQQTVSGRFIEDRVAPAQEHQESCREALVHLEATDDVRFLGSATVAGDRGETTTNSDGKRESMASSTSSAGVGKGRRRGSIRKAKYRKRPGEGASGGTGAAEDGNPAKIDSEWENEIAKNILSLYQTKLKADLDARKGAREDELVVSLSDLCDSIFVSREAVR